MTFRRVVWIVLDSVGIGKMPDSVSYDGHYESDTLGNIARLRPMHLPTLSRLGLGNIKPLAGIAPAAAPAGAYGKCALASPGKDTTTGHWEMVGIHLEQPFPLYPDGFPAGVMADFEARIGRGTLGNKAASGTEILVELGEEHLRTGRPIVYTSADSVFQIAAHEDVIPLEELHRQCEIARALLPGIGRVIARPFSGVPGAFARTANRHDYAVAPPPGMLLDRLQHRGIAVDTVGKISDIFLGRGIRHSEKTKSNADGMAKTVAALSTLDEGLIFVNLVDFDSVYGHRNDVEGYARALEEVDAWLATFLPRLADDDLLVLTADHGCDPTTASTDHSREYTPLLCYGRQANASAALGTRASLSDIGQTVAENFGCQLPHGASFLPQITPPKNN